MAKSVRWVDDQGVEGAIVECGVWRGGNIILARKLSPYRMCWLYDTFSGMPPPEEVDTKRRGGQVKAGKMAVSVDEVRNNMRATGTLNDSYLRFIVGMVEQTLFVPDNVPDKIALLRLDTDWYASTKVELEVLYPRLSPGGLLIVDDYGHWMGCKKAVDEYFSGHAPPMHPIDYTAVWMMKPC